MPRIEIPFKVKNTDIKLVKRVDLIAGVRNYIYATFIFMEPWDKIKNKQAVFMRNNISYVMPLLKNGDVFECVIPYEVMEEEGYFSLGVFGGDRLESNIILLEVIGGCCLSSIAENNAPTPDWFCSIETQIMKMEGVLNHNEITNDEILNLWNGIMK